MNYNQTVCLNGCHTIDREPVDTCSTFDSAGMFEEQLGKPSKMDAACSGSILSRDKRFLTYGNCWEMS
jgi:hypothetical protein